MEFCTKTFCVIIFTLKLAASSPFYGDELSKPSGDYQTLGASHNGYVPEETPLGLTHSQNTNFHSNNAYREHMNPEHYGFSRNGYENHNRPQVGSLLPSRQANNEFSTLPINLNRNRYPHPSLGEESFLNNPSESRFNAEPFERGNINFNHQPSGLHLSGLPVHNENIRNLEPFRGLQNERIRNLEPMHAVSEPYYNPRQNMFNINSYQNGAQIKNNNIPSNEHVQNVPEPLWNNVPLPNRGINQVQNLHQLLGGIHPGYNVQQLISNPQIKEALQNIGINSKKRYLIIHADGSVEHTDTLAPTIATNPNNLFINKEHVILNGNPPAVTTENPEILSSPLAIDEVGTPSLTANPLEDLKLNNEENENGPFDTKELLDKEIITGLSKTSKKPLESIKSVTHHFVHKTPKNIHSTVKPPSADDEEYEESATKAVLLTPSIAEYTEEEDDDEKNPLKTSSSTKKTPRTTTSSTKSFNTEYNVDVESKISTSATKPTPISTTTPQHNDTHTITPPLTHKIATHLHHHTTAHTLKTSTTKSPSLNDDDSNDGKFRKPFKHSSAKTPMTKTPKIHRTSDNEGDDELKTSKGTKKPTTQKTTITRKFHNLQHSTHSTTNKYTLRETPTTTEDSSEIYYEDEYEYYLTEKPPNKSYPTKNSKRSKSSTSTSTKRPSKTTRPSKIMSPKHYSSESEENDEESPKNNKKVKYDDENENNNERNKHNESSLSNKKNKKSKYDSEDENDNIGNKHNSGNSSINVKRKHIARNKSKSNKKKGKDDEEYFESYDDKKVSFNKNGTCCRQITKHVIQNLYKEHEDPESLLIYHLNNVTVVERDTMRTLYPNGTVIEEISDYLVDNNDNKIQIRTKVNIIHPDEYEEEEESDWY